MFPGNREKHVAIVAISFSAGVLIGISAILIDRVDSMETRDYITIFSVAAVILGWFVNSWFNRRHEIFKKRLDYRLKMLESYIPVAATLEKVLNPKNSHKRSELTIELVENLEHAQVQFIMYGTEYEIECINRVMVLAQKDLLPDMKNTSAALIVSIRDSLRGELGMERLAVP